MSRRTLEGFRREALFEVKHDAQRPFIVLTQAARVRAVGTRFDVCQHGTATTVSVIEGVVQIATARPDRGNPSSATTAIHDRLDGVEARHPRRNCQQT
jgi:transmembrane sensor